MRRVGELLLDIVIAGMFLGGIGVLVWIFYLALGM